MKKQKKKENLDMARCFMVTEYKGKCKKCGSGIHSVPKNSFRCLLCGVKL